jgi:hypothetical protein
MSTAWSNALAGDQIEEGLQPTGFWWIAAGFCGDPPAGS